MTTYKNNGVAGNVLSDLDLGSAIRDSHNVDLNALDVNIVNDLITEKFHRIAYTYKDMGDGTQEVEYINYYSEGTKEVSKVDIRENPQGTYEYTTFGFSGQIAANLSSTYMVIYDDVGSVGLQFRLDGGATAATGAARDIIIDIATGDSAGTLASKFAAALDADSKFTGVAASTAAVIQSSTVGNKTDANQGTTTITVTVTDGIDTLAGKYYLLYAGKDRTAYYVYYTIDGAGTDPAISGKTGIVVALLSSDTLQSQVATKEAAAIDAVADFTATSNGNTVTITNTYYGATTDIADGDAGHTFTIVTSGSTGSLVASVRVFFDANNLITNIERVA